MEKEGGCQHVIPILQSSSQDSQKERRPPQGPLRGPTFHIRPSTREHLHSLRSPALLRIFCRESRISPASHPPFCISSTSASSFAVICDIATERARRCVEESKQRA